MKTRPESRKFYADNPSEAMWVYFRTLETAEGLRRATGASPTDQDAQAARDTIRQAREYYAAARQSPLLTRPVLLYYGMVSLAKLVFLTSAHSHKHIEQIEEFERKGHGLKHHDCTAPSSQFKLELGEIEVTCDGKPGRLVPRGLFPNLANAVSGGDTLHWLGKRVPILQLMRSVPQLEASLDEVLAARPNYLGLGVANIQHQDGAVDFRVDLARAHLADPADADARVPYLSHTNFRFAPGSPQGREPTACLHIPAADSPWSHAVREEFYAEAWTLPAAFEGVRLESLLASYMLMYALSIVARYKPHRWAAVLEGKESPMLPVIEAFMYTCERWWPNMLLNHLTGKWLRFAQPTYL